MMASQAHRMAFDLASSKKAKVQHRMRVAELWLVAAKSQNMSKGSSSEAISGCKHDLTLAPYRSSLDSRAGILDRLRLPATVSRLGFGDLH